MDNSRKNSYKYKIFAKRFFLLFGISCFVYGTNFIASKEPFNPILLFSFLLLISLLLFGTWMSVWGIRKPFLEFPAFQSWIVDLIHELDTMPPVSDYSVKKISYKMRGLLLAGLFRQRVLATLLRRAPFGIVILDSMHQPLYVNKAFRDMLGYSWKEMSQMTPHERSLLMKPLPQQFNVLDQIGDAPAPLTKRIPYSFKNVHGEFVLVNVQTSSFVSGAGIEGTIMFVEELTDYERFVRLETQAIQILEVAVQGIGIFSSEGKVIYVNDTFARITGQSKETWNTKRIYDLGVTLSSAFYDSLQAHTSIRGITDSIKKGDETRSLSYDFLPIFTESQEPISVLVWCRDLTADLEWQMIRHQADLFQSLSQMAASMAHEVRNPMASVLGFLQLLRESRPDDVKVVGYTDVMLDEIRRVNEIITEYLSMSKVSVASWELLDLETIVKEMSLLLEGETNFHSLQLQIKTEPISIYGDVRRIKQVLLNVAKNAIEATPSGGTIGIVVKGSRQNAIVEISDTGTGMSLHTQEQIFQPYFTTKAEGTGLGLAVCREIVEQHGGTITVTSKEGVGTLFTLAFPLPK